MGKPSDIEKLVKETVKCTLKISCKDCVMLNKCMMRMIEFHEGIVAKRCPNCGSAMEYYGRQWKCPKCLHRIVEEE